MEARPVCLCSLVSADVDLAFLLPCGSRWAAEDFCNHSLPQWPSIAKTYIGEGYFAFETVTYRPTHLSSLFFLYFSIPLRVWSKTSRLISLPIGKVTTKAAVP